MFGVISNDEILEVRVAVRCRSPRRVAATEKCGEVDPLDQHVGLGSDVEAVHVQDQPSVEPDLDLAVELSRCVEGHVLNDVLPLAGLSVNSEASSGTGNIEKNDSKGVRCR